MGAGDPSGTGTPIPYDTVAVGRPPPEITGISTSVGANGNLEMALLTSGTTDDTNTYKNLDKITSAVGDSGKAVTEKNLTWGNLVDLKDESYGLGKIKLMPAALNITKAAAGAFTVKTENLLATPTYGTDGRVAAGQQGHFQVAVGATVRTAGWRT